MQTLNEQATQGSSAAKTLGHAHTDPAPSSAHSIGASITGLMFAAADHYVTTRKDRLLDAVVDIAAEVRRSGRRFEGQQDWIADAVDTGASRIRDVAEKLRAADSYELFQNSLAFARRRPRAAMSLVVLAGVVGARFVKHSWSESTARAASAH